MYDSGEYNIFLLVIWLAFAFWAGSIAKNKGRSVTLWVILTFLFPIALVILAFLKPIAPVPGKWKKCPHCASIIKEEAQVCPHCQRDVVKHP